MPFVAALIFWRRSDDRVAVFASLALLIFGTATFGFTMPALAAEHPGLQTPVALLHFLGAACFGLFLYVFPDGRFVPRWTGAVAGRVDRLAAGRAHLSGLDHRPGRLADPHRDFGLAGRAGHVDLFPDPPLPAPGEPTATAADQVGRVRDLGGVRRISGLDLALSALGASPEPETPGSVLAYLIGYTFASYLVMLLVPLTIGIAMLRHHLFDVDLVIKRTLVYGTLTACVIGLYVLVVGSVGMVVQIRGNFVVSLLAVGLVAVVFAPLRSRLQRAVNHLLYGQRDEPYAVVSRLGQRLEATLTPDAVLPAVVRTVKEALKLPYAAIEARSR